MQDLGYEYRKNLISKCNYTTQYSYSLKDKTLLYFIIYKHFSTKYLMKIILNSIMMKKLYRSNTNMALDLEILLNGKILGRTGLFLNKK